MQLLKQQALNKAVASSALSCRSNSSGISPKSASKSSCLLEQEKILQADTFRVNEHDCINIGTILLDVLLEGQLSQSDFYHDKAFSCLLIISTKLNKSYQNLKARQKQGLLLNIQASAYATPAKPKPEAKQTKEELLLQSLRAWMKNARAKIVSLIQVADLKLTEYYWKVIRQHCDYPDFLDLLLRLKLQKQMATHIQAFLPSRSL